MTTRAVVSDSQPRAAENGLPNPPEFHGGLLADTRTMSGYLTRCAERIADLPPRAERTPVQQDSAEKTEAAARRVRHRFLALHAGRVYDELTAEGRPVRLDELVFTAAEQYPGLVPSRAWMAADRLLPQTAKSDGEIDQGIFFAHLLHRRDTGERLLRSMLAPTTRALALLPEFRRSGRLDLGQAVVRREGCMGEVTICNQQVLNAEDDAVVEALETAIDLVLLDDAVAVGVLRGSVLTHPRYAGRRSFGAGINLTDLYAGRIGFVDFMLRRELGYIRKLIHGLYQPAGDGGFDLPAGKPWVGAVDTFAIGGATQVALVLDRVIAESDAYFSLPALNEGIIPGAANLRLARLLGRRMAQRMIFFGEQVAARDPEARMLCDETVEPETMDAAIATAVERLADPAVPSNRRMLHLAEEPEDQFRVYLSRYSLEQSARMHSPDVVMKLKHTWIDRRQTASAN